MNQTTSIGYTQTAAGGFGLWSTSTTDANGQTTTFTYDGLGRPLSQTLPGETPGLTTSTASYSYSACSGTGAQQPCVEMDQTQRLDSSHTVVTRAFYDGDGRLVETRSPGPPGQDVVRYRFYDPMGHAVFESISYLVTAYAGVGSTYSLPDSTQPGATATYDGLGRALTVKDALSNTATASYSIVCGTISGDSACYEQGLVKDPLNHQQAVLGDALGLEVYGQSYTGNSQATYAVYATTKYKYDYNGNLTQITHPNGTSTTTFQYDMASRLTGMTDPDRGTESYVYDANGNPTQSTDARGGEGTIYAGYDGLNRQLWRSVNSNGSSPYVTHSYDNTTTGGYGIGHLTGETFVGGPSNSLTGSYRYAYDQRGRQVSQSLTVGATTYTVSVSYDDAGDLLTEQYPTGEVVTNSYTGGWLTRVTQQQGSVTTNLLSNVSYTGVGGAGHQITGATLGGNTYQYSATYDQLLEPTDLKFTRVSDGAVMFEEQRSFDAARNVSSLTATLPQGTDVQRFCYDEQDRLTWAGSVGTPPCTGTAITPGTLTSAQYAQSFTYDNLNRLTSGPLGTYTYGDSAHLHGVTNIGSTYAAAYDAAGNQTCRSTSLASGCHDVHTGADLLYDAEGRLKHWLTRPVIGATDDFLYDGEGNRVEQQVLQNGVTTTTAYVGKLEEVSTTGTTTTTTTYYYAGGMRIALAVNGVFSYLATSGLGSVSVALSATGTPQASQLYAPYGGARYSNGTMPGTYGFTGQHSDAAMGLDYYHARYYDPVAGQFVSPDVLPAGLDRYAYVGDNPETYVDPTGHVEDPISGWLSIRELLNRLPYIIFRLWIQI